jgi:hypothetical protein
MEADFKQKVVNFYKTNTNNFINLYFRWSDEKEYEDFNDYIALMKVWVEKGGFEFVKGTKKPFGFKFKGNNHILFMYKKGNKIKIEEVIA